MDTEFLPLLIRLLAESDTVMRPVRDWSDSNHVSAVMERQRQFLLRGLPFRPGIAGKQCERLADQLELTGEVVFSRSKGRQHTWKLADRGDWQIRSLCGLYPVAATVTAMLAIQTHEEWVIDKTLNLVSEEWLAGCGCQTDAERDRIFDCEQILSPALCRGWVRSNSDLHGHVAYNLTSEGRSTLNNWAVLFADISLPAYSEAAGDAYGVAIQSARVELQNLSSASVGITSRLSCGLWPDDSEAAPIPPVFKKNGTVRLPDERRRAIVRAKKHIKKKLT